MRCASLFLTALIGACSAPAVNAPSLAPRAAEAIDPRLSVANAEPQGPADPALVARLNGLIQQARAGDPPFQAAIAEAERLAAAAGEPQGEAWVVAQQALSVAIAAREPVTTALGDIDAIGSVQLAAKGGMAPADQAALAEAAAAVGDLDRKQAGQVEQVRRRLGG